MNPFFRKFRIPFSFLFTLGVWIGLPAVLSAQSIFEQIGRLPVTTYTPEEYGGYPSVWAAIQSEEGLMYFGTGYGVHEYDGVNWRSLFDRNNSVTIRGLAKETKGRIFYAGTDFGYLMSNPKGEMQAVSLLHLIPEEIRSGINFFSINFLDSYIFLQSRDQLIRLELAEDYSLKSLKTWPAETTFTFTFVQGADFFIHQNERGLFQLIGEEIKLVQGTEILGKDRFRIMLPYPSDKGKTFLFGGYSTGFYLFDGNTVSKFPTQVDQLIKGGAGLLYHAFPYQGNYILSFSGAGIVIMSPKGEILNRIGTEQGLPTDVMNEVYLDKGQGLWAMTEDGIARIAIDSPIQTFGKELGINSGVKSIRKQDGKFFLGTSNGLLKFDEKSKTFQFIPEINSIGIIDLYLDGEDLIVPSSQLQVFRDDKAIRLDFPKDMGRPITTFIPKNNPNLLMVGTSSGLLLYERGLSKGFPWELKGKVPGIGSISTYFFEGKDGTIFIGGAGKIHALNLESIGLEIGNTTGIKNTVFEVNASEDSFSLVDGELYKTSPQGMQKYSSKEGKFLPNDDFSEVEKDMFDFIQHNSGILWYESLAGKKFVLKRNEVGKFVKDDTPNSVAPYLSEIDFIDEDSIMWFGSPKGLIRYDPKKDKHTDKEFYTLIRRIESKADTLPLIAYGRDKTLPSMELVENSLRFEFAAPYFEEEKKTKYQTYLEGFDADWVDWNDNRFKEYTNLSPGAYTFHVRAMAFTGRVSEEAFFSFVVLPPWYATWWAYLIYFLLFVGLITAIVKWRSQKLKAENQILEERVKERTAELEKSYHNVELLGEIGRKITASLSAEKIIATVYANVNALMEASVFGIGIYHEETQTLDFPATYENGEALNPYSNSIKDPNRLSALCFNTGNEIVINNLNEEYGKYLQKMPTPSKGEAPVSLIYLPLKVKGKMFGVITVQSFTKNAFSEYHLYMLRTIGVYTAIALENAESFQNLQQTLGSLKATQSQLIQSEKMASLGELTAGIAHEIQNPLNFVNNFSELNKELVQEANEELAKGEIEEAKAILKDIGENAEKIHHHGKRADSIVKGMLAHSRSSSGERMHTDINALADEYLRLSYHGLRAKDKGFFAEFTTELDSDLPKVNVVPQDMGRVLLNLINNAFQACAGKDLPGFVDDDKENLAGLTPMVTVSTKNLGDKIEISVQDNGPGIPDSIKEKIFQPFFTTKPAGSGTGLGLSLSYDIVKAHGGELKVDSEVGKGTTFRVLLPV
ncbi:ATP-binding protein [Algoriphagus sp.]|uniref:ATP-binding protein n=1 Tax=Algoriphagus sp. TaxID=1872435 RepID=UPI0039193A02